MNSTKVISFPVNPEVLKRWANDWDEPDGDGRWLWNDIEHVASRFWNVYAETTRLTQECISAWNHLLLAVANFKRSSGRVRGLWSTTAPETARPRAEVILDGERDIQISREGKPAEFRTAFNRIPGFGVATGSALLAALWPDWHLIIDRRALAVALVLDQEGWNRLRENPAYTKKTPTYPTPTWEDYQWFADRARASVATETGMGLSVVERAFYVLDRAWDNQKEYGTTEGWEEYRSWVTEHLEIA